MILASAQDRVPAGLPFEEATVHRVREAVEESREELPGQVRQTFRYEIEQVMDHFLPRAELGGGTIKAKLDRTYSVFAELRLQVYGVFVAEICDWAAGPRGPDVPGFHDTPLVTKVLDIVDNLRTCEVVTWTAIERALLKAETFLDKSFYLHDLIHRRGFEGTTFIPLYDYLKYHLVEQLSERRRALAFLADTRFAFLAGYLVREINRLQGKYLVAESPVEKLKALREEIGRINRSRGGED